jgi:hypothetical protein
MVFQDVREVDGPQTKAQTEIGISKTLRCHS